MRPAPDAPAVPDPGSACNEPHSRGARTRHPARMPSTWLLVLAVVVWTLLFVGAWEWLDRREERRDRELPDPIPDLQPILVRAGARRGRRGRR